MQARHLLDLLRDTYLKEIEQWSAGEDASRVPEASVEPVPPAARGKTGARVR